MLKHNDIISKLSDAQKIRIISNVSTLSGKDLKILGIPKINTGYLADYARELYPEASVLANSWSPALWKHVSLAKISRMTSDGVNFIVAPGAKIKLCPYRKEISEDAHLASVISQSYASASSECGAITGLSGYYLTKSDTEWMDEHPFDRVINEQINVPYYRALTQSGARAILTDVHELGEEYDVRSRAMRDIMLSHSDFLVCNQASDDNTVEFITKGIICLSASANALENAYSKYKKIKQMIERGSATEEMLLSEADNCTVISPEQLDSALDRVLDFLFECQSAAKNVRIGDFDEQALAYKATADSTVLLKNKGDLLPLSKENRIAVIGNPFGDFDSGDSVAQRFSGELVARGYNCVGALKGYDAESFDDGRLIGNAMGLCKSADTVILLLGIPARDQKNALKNMTLSLPANQLHLVHRIKQAGKRMIAVISSPHSCDVEFTRDLDALLLSPLEVGFGAAALADIISGVCNPSGRLASTLYAGSDAAFNKRLLYKREYGIKSGPFIGYKYYDTAGLQLGYPFGYGLSYSTFQYSSLTLTNNRVNFEVKNTSSRRGAETAQVYVGISGSAVLRPKKELCAFERIELEPGESKKISLAVSIPAIYQNGEYITEGGSYEIYVGASVSDIKLHGKIRIDGKAASRDGERLIDYLQSESNIIEDKFTLEADYSFMKRSIKNIVFGVGAVALAVCLAVFNVVSGASSLFLGIITGIVAIAAISFFINDAQESTEDYKEERAKIEQANRAHFNGAEEGHGLNPDTLFHEAFDADVAVAEETEAVEDFIDENVMEFIDTGFTMADAVSEFLRFALERGYKFERTAVENLFISFATSKFIVTNMPIPDFNECMLLLSEYFGCRAFVDTLDESGTAAVGANGSYENMGSVATVGMLPAIRCAGNSRDKIHVYAINNARCASIYELIRPLMRYINAPKAKNDIEIFNENGINVGYSISPNLWLVVNLAEGEYTDALPLSITRVCSANYIGLVRGQQSESRTLSHGLNRHQLEYIVEKSKGKTDIPEELWKKIDKLEKYVSEYSDYKIGNKLWLGFEKHTALLTACGEELAEAADFAIAVRLLPSMSSILRNKLAAEDKTLVDTLEFIFGSENISASRESLKMMLNEPEESKDAKNAPSQGASDADDR